MWQSDPFKWFLRIYGFLVFIGLLLLLTSKQEINNWFFKNSAYSLLEAEVLFIEELWYEEGEYAVRKEISIKHNSMFKYEFKSAISNSEFETWEEALELEQEPNIKRLTEISPQLTQRYLNEEELESLASIVTYLPSEASHLPLYISINRDYFNILFSTFNFILISVGFVLLLGFIAAFLMISVLKARLTEINEASKKIQLTNNLSERIPSHVSEGPLADTVAQINQMLDSIEHSVNTTKQQANNIAHDLRTPITSVYNKIQKIAQQNPELVDIELILERLLTTFNQLLRINRLESSGDNIPTKPTLIAEVIKDVAELYAPILEDKAQTLNLVLNDTHIAVVNNELLFQILCNLIDNASKFSPENSYIEIRTETLAKEIYVYIADQGGGVDNNNLSKLSHKFYREENSRSTAGNGLGLSFVSAATNRMNGHIHIANKQLLNKAGLCITLIFNNL